MMILCPYKLQLLLHIYGRKPTSVSFRDGYDNIMLVEKVGYHPEPFSGTFTLINLGAVVACLYSGSDKSSIPVKIYTIKLIVVVHIGEEISCVTVSLHIKGGSSVKLGITTVQEYCNLSTYRDPVRVSHTH